MFPGEISKVKIENIVDLDDLPDNDSTGRSPIEEIDSSVISGDSFHHDDHDGEVKEHQKPSTPAIASKAHAAVRTFKMVIYGLMAAFSVGLCLVVYFYLNGEETKEFERTFSSHTFSVFDSMATQLESNLALADSFALALISYARTSGSKWPLVTLPDSTDRMSKLRAQTESSIMTLLHLVSDETRPSYEKYVRQNYEWANDTVAVQAADNSLDTFGFNLSMQVKVFNRISNASGEVVPTNTGPYAASWQTYPLIEGSPSFNVDYFGDVALGLSLKRAVASQTVQIAKLSRDQVLFPTDTPGSQENEPVASLIYPVLEGNQTNALLALTFPWSIYFKNILREGQRGLVIVVTNECSGAFTYMINGPKAQFVGFGDHHLPDYGDLEMIAFMPDLLGEAYTGVPVDRKYCAYTLKAYPSETLEEDVRSIAPLLFAFGTLGIFIFSTVMFRLYDALVDYRQRKVMRAAAESEAIVSQLFPESVRKRLYKEKKKSIKKEKKKKGFQPAKTKMRNFLSEGSVDGDEIDLMGADMDDDRPIADLFPETTILFADIAGFTAWSSVREPSQVFTLLEKIYGAFDRIAMRRGVFKVETIGDSYIAVCGLPEPRADHALVMVKFADQCRDSFSTITRELEFTLGPETGDLRMRFGLNSGPTTAGVLRGQKSRFQLFGDTVNTAARMESTGMANFIHLSQTTAALLVAAKKEHWLEARTEKIDVKGKGMMQTYWADPRSGFSVSMHSSSADSAMAEIAHRNERMIYWCTDIMAKLLVKIVARRDALARTGKKRCLSDSSTIASVESVGIGFDMGTSEHSDCSRGGGRKMFKKNGQVIDEVVEVINLPEFDASIRGGAEREISLDIEVMKQLRAYVTEISGTYRENPFHSFEHASHVLMSVAKLLSRIVAPDIDVDDENVASNLHDYTYGITSDPLTQFACVFAALIHDSDHYGISNAQLVAEKAAMAYKYKNRSPAEQNSVNIAWKVLMKSQFSLLRATICPTDEEMVRFRQLVVNSVMATDIADKEMKELRDSRWAKAFSDESRPEESARTNINRKATIVIEHLLQASDVAHTMQHWHVYTKWNERLFQEMSLAYLVGRAQEDPANFWYKGELGFFDFYIIPLAKKLSECGVFGVSSDEYLNYAMRNREEWERRGNEILEGLKASFQEKLRNEYGHLAGVVGIQSAALGIDGSFNEEKEATSVEES